MPDLRVVARVALRLAVAAMLVAAVGAVAHLPLGETQDHAALRVALRSPNAQIEVCREPTAEESAALPVHMRRPRHCEITTVDYRLRVEVDGSVLLDRAVVHHGVRRNRPLVVDELLRVAPGSHRISVTFAPSAAVASEAAADLPRAAIESAVEFTAGRVRLLTLDAGSGGWTLAG